MQLAPSVKDNIKFLYLETSQQLERLCKVFASNPTQNAKDIESRHEYILNLGNIVQNDCIDAIGKKSKSNLSHRCLYDSALHLKNISTEVWTLATIESQHLDIKNRKLLAQNKSPLRELSIKIHQLFLLAEPFFRDTDTGIGKELCDAVDELNSMLGDYINTIKAQATDSTRPVTQDEPKTINSDEVVYLVHLFDHLEKIGLHLTHLGESLLSIDHQQILTIHQFRVLNTTMKSMESTGTNEAYSLQPVAETKSGCSISGVTSENTKEQDDYLAIYKGGKSDKIRNEKEQFETWDQMFPGVAPKIISFNEKGKSAGLLIEYIKGRTFEQLLLAKNSEETTLALDQILQDMKGFWLNTLNRDNTPSANYIKQLKKRLPKVLSVHPEYSEPSLSIDTKTFNSLNQDIDACLDIEKQISTPFSVYTHGDLNIDNIIYEQQEQRSRFIDLHRSSHMDYLQDISVFMVSCYRLQVIDPVVRKAIQSSMHQIFYFAKTFAIEQQDTTFDLRLALGLARSFITSTRFILDDTFSNDLFYRGRYLLQTIARQDKNKLTDYHLPKDVLNV